MKLIHFLESKVNQLLKLRTFMEGGGTQFQLNNKKYSVSKIDLVKTKNTLSNFKKYLFNFFNEISDLVKEKIGIPLWGNEEPQLSGSSHIIFKELEIYIKDENNKEKLIKSLDIDNKEILKDENELVYKWLKKFKSSAGDIDVQVSKEPKFFESLRQVLYSNSISGGEKVINLSEELFLKELNKKCKKIGDICIIDNKTSISQIISAVAIKQSNEFNTLSDFLFFQVDWEPVESDENGVPTEWAKTSMGSSILDIEHGIKGREHKFLLRVISNVLGESNDIKNLKILSPKNLKEIKGSGEGLYSFSVLNGLRKKYWDPNNKEELKKIKKYYFKNYKFKNIKTEKELNELLSNKNIRVEVPTEEKIYITGNKQIASKIGIKEIDSFVNIAYQLQDLTKDNKHLANKILNLFEERLIEQLTITPNSIENGTPEEKVNEAFNEDYTTKIKALKLLKKILLGNENIDDFKKTYDKWKDSQVTRLLKTKF